MFNNDNYETLRNLGQIWLIKHLDIGISWMPGCKAEKFGMHPFNGRELYEGLSFVFWNGVEDSSDGFLGLSCHVDLNGRKM